MGITVDGKKYYSLDDTKLYSLLRGKVNRMVKTSIAKHADHEHLHESVKSSYQIPTNVEPPRHNIHWGDVEEDNLLTEFESWITIQAESHQRTEGAIRWKVHKLLRKRTSW